MMLPSDNDLDKLSQDAAEHFEPTGASPDWKHMEQLLNKDMPLKKKPRRRIFFILFFACFLLGGGFIYYNLTGDRSREIPFKTDTAIEDELATVVPDKTKGEVTDRTIVKTQVSPNSPQAPAPVAVLEPAKKEGDQNISRAKLIPSKKSVYKNRGILSAEIEENIVTAKTESSVDPETVIDKAAPATDLVNAVPDTQSNKAANTTLDKSKIAATVAATDSIKPTVKKNKPAPSKKQRFEISALYAPELTTIGWTDIDKPGSNYGLLIGYGLSNNLSIHTGLIKSRKNYTANGEDFHYYSNPGSQYKLTKVTGYCSMYEIPLNIKFRFLNRKNYSLYGLGGISSYFMKSEFYNYQYSLSSYNWSASYASQQNYWLSVATLGVGIEKGLSKDLSVAVNPFMKIPFQEMGKGHLKLQSAGLNFLLTYKPQFTKKKK